MIDLKIDTGKIDALVIGSSSRPYAVGIAIKPMRKDRWNALVKRAAGRISSLMALARGKLPEEMLKDFCDPETGLFPKPSEIRLSCSCPDGASCCKHVAAVLYGVGARLDSAPELFFALRGIDPESIVAADVVDTLTDGSESELEAADLGDVFGIDIDTDSSRQAAKPVRALTPDFPSRVKALRLKLGLSQTEFGKKIGTHQVGVSLLERGKSRPSASILSAFSELEKGSKTPLRAKR